MLCSALLCTAAQMPSSLTASLGGNATWLKEWPQRRAAGTVFSPDKKFIIILVRVSRERRCKILLSPPGETERKDENGGISRIRDVVIGEICPSGNGSKDRIGVRKRGRESEEGISEWGIMMPSM